MKASTDRSFHGAFVLTSDAARKLALSVEKLIAPPKFEAECQDGLKREFPDVESLLEFSNSPAKAITTLRVSAITLEPLSQLTLRLNNGNLPIYFLINGEERMVSDMLESLSDRAGEMRPWYSFVTRIDFVDVSFWVLMAGFGGLVALFLYGALRTNAPLSFGNISGHDLATTTIIETGIMLALLVGGRLLNRLRNFLFQKGTFAFGQAANRHKHLEFVRVVVVVGFIISFLSSLAVAILQAIAHF